jgi:protein-histidine N-methyltransferase
MGKKGKNTPESCKEMGNKAFNNNEYEKAINWYTKGLELNPNHNILLSNRSAVYLLLHDYEKALEDSSKSIAIDPRYIKAYHRKASALREVSKFQEALFILSEALAIQQDSQEILDLKKEILKDYEINNVLPTNHPEREKFDSLVRWLQDGGAVFPKLQMRFYSQDYRGVHSTSFISKDECILFVPKSHIITLEMAKAAPIGAKMVEANLDLLSPKHCFLTSYILQEKVKPDSFWIPYLKILPEKYSNFPIFYTDEEKVWLKGSPFLDQVNEKIDDIKEDYNTICNAVPEFAQFNIKDFSMVRMAVSSRIFGMQIDEIKTDGFVPLADMLNHRRPRQTSWNYDQSRNGFVIDALENIERGEEVLDSYGKKCNSRFLLNYGFINRNNDANEYPFKVKLRENDEHFNIKKSLLTCTSQTIRLQADLTEPVLNEFLGLMRFIELDDISILPQLLQDCQDDKGLFKAVKIPPISIENEKKVLLKFQEMIKQGISKYQTSLEDDQEILKGELTENQTNCILMRMGEKVILNFFLDMINFVLTLIDLPQKEIKRAAKGSKYEVYIANSILLLKRQ